MCNPLSAPTVLAAILPLFLVAAATAQPRGGDARTRPPDSFACSPNDLTSYAGVVTEYRRDSGRTRLRIRTDWETTEPVTIRHPGSDDPSPWFRYAGETFADSDWARIEPKPRRLRAGARATAWVCSDGRTIVDWEATKK